MAQASSKDRGKVHQGIFISVKFSLFYGKLEKLLVPPKKTEI